MPTLNSQILYGWVGSPKTIKHGEGDSENDIISLEDYVSGMKNAETALGQKILQDNAETHRLNDAITDSAFTTLSGAASLADVIAEVNKINTFLSTQLVKLGKE